MELELDPNGKIVDAFFTGQGCVISQASASMLLEAMQGSDGAEALRRLRDNPATAELPVVAVTAFAMKEDGERT